ncbi:MAG TPA: response regulator transcription factor [Solirubrobacterales bacterium]|nr:response regulator transcription factor [Solirubrobacterales bacterium]
MPVELREVDGPAAAAASEPICAALIGAGEDVSARLESALASSPEMPVRSSEGAGLGSTSPLPAADVYVTPCDLSQRGSLGTVEALVERLSGPLVLVVGADANAREMKAALRAGVAGLVRESDVATTLAGTVRAVGGGQLAVPIELGRQIEKPVLSRRQKQVLGLVVLGLSNGEIAAKLHLSEHTVKCHLYASFRKLGVSSRDEAVSLILDPDEGLGTGILVISQGKAVGGGSDNGEPAGG